MSENAFEIRSDVLAVWFCNGDGVLFRLDLGDLQRMARRDKALAKALLDVATQTVDEAGEES